MQGDDVRTGKQAEQRLTSRIFIFWKLTIMRHQLYLNLQFCQEKTCSFVKFTLYLFIIDPMLYTRAKKVPYILCLESLDRASDCIATPQLTELPPQYDRLSHLHATDLPSLIYGTVWWLRPQQNPGRKLPFCPPLSPLIHGLISTFEPFLLIFVLLMSTRRSLWSGMQLLSSLSVSVSSVRNDSKCTQIDHVTIGRSGVACPDPRRQKIISNGSSTLIQNQPS
jgi:hypothetical protein